jgi:hypothetical protein
MMSDGWSSPVLGKIRRTLKLSRHTRLTLELIAIAALAVGMGVGFGKLRQPSASAESAEPSALALEPPLARVIAPAQAPAPVAEKQEALPIRELKQPDPVQLEFVQPVTPGASANEPALEQLPSPALDAQPPAVAAPRGAPARARHAPRPRKLQSSRAELARAEAAPQPAPAEAPPPKPRAPNAWDMDAYGGRR